MESIKTRHLVWDKHLGCSVERLSEQTHHGPSRKYLKGPVPWGWIQKASLLPGKALVVGLCIWRISGVTKSKTVKLANSELEAFGIKRDTKSRALRALRKHRTKWTEAVVSDRGIFIDRGVPGSGLGWRKPGL